MGIDTLGIKVVTVSLIALNFPYLHVILFVLFKLNSFFMLRMHSIVYIDLKCVCLRRCKYKQQ